MAVFTVQLDGSIIPAVRVTADAENVTGAAIAGLAKLIALGAGNYDEDVPVIVRCEDSTLTWSGTAQVSGGVDLQSDDLPW